MLEMIRDNRSYVAPDAILYNPLNKSYFRTTHNSKIIPKTFKENLDLLINGIDFKKINKISNCIAVQ